MVRVFVVALLIHFSASGQTVHRSYFDKSGFETDSINSYRFIESDFSGSNSKSVAYYTATGKIQWKDITDSSGTKKTYYHTTEKVRAEVILNKDRSIRNTRMFYPGGKKQGELSTDEKTQLVQVLNYWDSVGHQIVNDGNGTCECVLNPEDEEPYIERGEVKNSMKVGDWKGECKEGKTFEEQYKNGGLIRGTMKDSEGMVYNYTEVSKQAEFVGGFGALAQYLGSTMRYPTKARRMGIQGTVFVSFVVEKDGSLSNVKIIKGVGEECDKEALRVVKGSKKWNPGLMRGKKVKSRFVLPIKFKLQ